jgi:nitrite reductase/ring-hydroxylating ferredoxin subunit
MSSNERDLMTRRQALKALAAASVCPLLINCEFVDYHGELVEESTFSLSDPAMEALEEIGARVCFQHGSRDILLIRVSEEEILGFDETCPHQDQPLGRCSGDTSNALWDQDEQTLTCPWHASVFAADGSVVDGPSQSPIETYRVEFDPQTGEGTVFSN